MIVDDITSKYVPPHVNIFYCLGGITLTCFLVQYIMTEANFGWLIRSVHG